MRSYHPWVMTVLVTWGGTGLAAAQSGAPSTAPARASEPAAAQEALTSSEDIAVLKALAPLRLTRAQLSELLPALQGAQAKLTEEEPQQAAKLAAWQGALEQARRDLLAGKDTGTRASEQFALAQQAAAQRRASLRADLVTSLRATLAKIVTPAQAAQMVGSGQAALMAQRMAGWRGGPGGGGPPGFGGRGDRGGPGAPGDRGGARIGAAGAEGRGGRGGGGGPGGGGPGGRLDRIREMTPAEFQQFNQQMADRMGGQSSPQFQQQMAFMNQVRDMPHAQYLLQRDQLAAQFGPGRGGFGAAMAGTDEEAIRAFVDRYLLSSRAPIVVRDRLRAP